MFAFCKSAVGVVLATAEYPYSAPKPQLIRFEPTNLPHSHLCFAGVGRSGADLLTTGGRVVVCVGVADSLQQARDNAYKLCETIHFEGKQMRDDIAIWALK